MQIRLAPFIKKETLHILRDPVTMVIVVLVPVVLLFLFGFAVTTEVNNVDVAVCAPHRSSAVDASVKKLCASSYFTFKGYVDHQQIDRMLRSGGAMAVVVFDEDYSRNGLYQIVIDAGEVNTASTSTIYIQSVLSGGMASAGSLFETRLLFNPQMKSAYNFVPGLMGMIFLLICALMTCVSIVKEKERGTMEVLLVSPVKPIYIMISKMIPYLLLSCIDLVIILLMARYVLDVPLAGGVWGIIVLSIVYLIMALSLGLIVSNVAQSQIVALLVCAVLMMMPVLLFSGMLFPVENLPWALRWITYIVPARWYNDALRRLMIEGVHLGAVMKEFLILCGMTVLLLGASLKKFNDRLE